MYTYTCKQCGVTFSRKNRRDNPFCSNACYHLWTRRGEELTCPVCGTKHFKAPSVTNRVFCSRTCYDKSRAPDLVIKICPRCGKAFSVNAKIADRYTVCSKACRLATRRYNTCPRCGKLFLNSERRYGRVYCSEECRRPPVEISCKECGRRFRICPGESDSRLFCSYACWRRYNGETSIEAAVRQTLTNLGISFVQEAPIGRYCIDFLLADLRIAMEVDGSYWHRPDVQPRDARKDAFLESYGWRVCRIGEHEIRTTADLSRLIAERLTTLADVHIDPLQPTLF